MRFLRGLIVPPLFSLNTRQMVRSRGELYDSEDLAGGVIFGEADRDPAAAAPRVKQVELPSVCPFCM